MKLIKIYKRENLKPSVKKSAYFRVKPIISQVRILSKYFPQFRQIKLSDLSEIKKVLADLPNYADGWLVVPHFKNYNQAVFDMLKILGRSFKNFNTIRLDEVSPDYLRMSKRTEEALLRYANIFSRWLFMLIPIQTGYQYIGQSPRRARLLFRKNEFGLGPFEIGCFILTHTSIIFRKNIGFGIDCIGAEYGPYRHQIFRYILFYYNSGRNLKFDSRWIGCPDKHFGAATGYFLEK